MTISVDFDDFSPLNHRFDMLAKLRERYKDFKVTMFTIPWEIRLNPDGKGTPITDEKYMMWCHAVKKGVEDGWLEVAIHGLTHKPLEFSQLSYQKAKDRVTVSMKMFENTQIPYVKMFKAPNWAISDGAKLAMKDLDIKVIEDGYYNWNLKDDMPDGEKLIAHGHVQDEPSTMNGIEQSYMRLSKVPPDAKWIFLSEALK